MTMRDYAPRVALVGNGPTGASNASTIDSHDLVIRFNECVHYGFTGTRTDVIVIVNTGLSGERLARDEQAINPAALASAHAVWLAKTQRIINVERTRYPDQAVHWGDFTDEIITNKVRDKPFRFLDRRAYWTAKRNVRRLGASDWQQPSTGLLTLFDLKLTIPTCSITLFGFTHDGWPGHPWDAERLLIGTWSHWVSYGDRAPCDG